jgi:hypothetical protein
LKTLVIDAGAIQQIPSRRECEAVMARNRVYRLDWASMAGDHVLKKVPNAEHPE